MRSSPVSFSPPTPLLLLLVLPRLEMPLSAHLLLCPRGLPPFATLRSLGSVEKKLRKQLEKNGTQERRRGKWGICRAELARDAPFAAAIGACVLNSLIFPIVPGGPDDEDGGGAIDTTDARFAVMGIISFIPYFNWMSWVFAWLDSSRQRYLVYAIVYLAPYLRTNLSLSPDESWLPVASILVCIIHVQLEASIRNGDLNGIQFFNEAMKTFLPKMRRKDTEFQGHQESSEGRSTGNLKLPTHDPRDKIREWRISKRPADDLQHLNENPDVKEKEENSD